MNDSIIYDDIFEAIRQLMPSHPVLMCKEHGGIMNRWQNFTVMDFGDGTCGAVTLSLDMCYYRGEPEVYETCRPKLYRIDDTAQRLIQQVKTCDFELFLLEVPEISQAIVQKEHVDLLALEQHYGFPTEMIDVSNDIMVAAFFATHLYNPITQTYAPAANGIGRIRFRCEPLAEGRLRIIGMQHFMRPGTQSGFGFVLEEQEDFSDMSGSILFHQSALMNKILSRAVNWGEMLFPPEPLSLAADMILRTSVVTENGIRYFCSRYEKNETDIRNILKENGIAVVAAPLCHPMFLPAAVNTQPVRGCGKLIRPGVRI